jgi:hypothetical protein
MWLPADQLDFIMRWPALSFWGAFDWPDILGVRALSLLRDIAVNHASFHLRVRDTKW